MNKNEALELLKHHSFTHDDIDNEKSLKGFLGMLRPFDGELYEDNFHELMLIITTLKEEISSSTLDQQIISKLWSIYHFSRVWGVEQGGMLRQNKLISDAQVELLKTWIDCISYTVLNLLENLADEDVFEAYTMYLESRNTC